MQKLAILIGLFLGLVVFLWVALPPSSPEPDGTFYFNHEFVGTEQSTVSHDYLQPAAQP